MYNSQGARMAGPSLWGLGLVPCPVALVRAVAKLQTPPTLVGHEVHDFQSKLAHVILPRSAPTLEQADGGLMADVTEPIVFQQRLSLRP